MGVSTDDLPPSLTGRVALVTGASRGIGRAIARRFAAAGATVIVTARSKDAAVAEHRAGKAVSLSGTLDETVALIEADGGRAFAIACDLEDAEERATLVECAAAHAGRLDIVVNNAGFADYTLIEDMPDATYHRTIEHYLTTPFILSRAAIPIMKAQGAGWIVNLGSLSALKLMRPYQAYATGGRTIYGAAKVALARLTQGLAAELYSSNIAVNLVAPSSAVRTPGADTYIPEGVAGEPVEYLAAVALDLAHAPAAVRTGLTTFSLHYAKFRNLAVTSLDGRTRMPPPPEPIVDHPDIVASGV